MTTETVFAREILSGGLTSLPRVNTCLTVSPVTDLDDAGRAIEIPSRVEDLRLEISGRRPASAELVIAQPMFAGNLVGQTPGTSYLLRWVTDRGIHEVTGRYLSLERIGPALIGWRLRVKGPVSRIQRRAHARVDVNVPIEVVVLPERLPGGVPSGLMVLRGMTVNLSEGGVLACLKGPAPAVGAAVMSRLGLGGETFVLSGRVVRNQVMPGRRAEAATAIAFDTPDAHGDRLRPLLFAHQLHARRLGVA